MELYTVQPSDGALLREVMVRMYTDSPGSFGETLAQAQARADAGWDGLAEMLGDLPYFVGFMARQDGRTVGFVGGVIGRLLDGRLNYTLIDTVTIGRTWVDLPMRGQGLGDTLVEAVAAWARSKGAGHLELQVTEDNERAIRFFQRVGFSATGHHEPFPPSPQVQMRYMRREL